MDDQVRSTLVWAVAGIVFGVLGGLVVGGSFLTYLVAALVGSIVVGFLAQLSKITAIVGNPLLADGAAGTAGAVIGVILWILVG